MAPTPCAGCRSTSSTKHGDIEKALTEIGLKLKAPSVPPIAAKVRSGMPAAAAGLEDGDRIVAINDTPVTDFAGARRADPEGSGAHRRCSVSKSSATRAISI